MNYFDFLSEASKVLRTSSIEVERVIISAPYRYKHYTIPKRDGGSRDIHHPSPALKAVQRWIVNDFLGNLPVHDCVYSYRRGRNIAMHASRHSHSNYITRFDFSDFFPSITGVVIRNFLVDAELNGFVNFDHRVMDAIIRLVCRHNKSSNRLVLSIGAPSSPHLSNALLYDFDCEMARVTERMKGIYTRYADDIYISSSSKESVTKLEEVFLAAVARRLPYLQVNKRKTQHLSRKRRMSVTGVNITPQRRLSVGRDLKRSIKTQVFLALQGSLQAEEISALRGVLAHISSIEPAFIGSLITKFGAEKIRLFMTSPANDVIID